jgi:hypothetical protein
VTQDIIRSIQKEYQIKASTITPDDVKRLSEILIQKTNEAKEFEITKYKEIYSNNPTEFENAKKNIDETFLLAISIKGKNGEFLGSFDPLKIIEHEFPDDLISITFDGKWPYQATHNNVDPSNWLTVNLVFFKEDIFNLSNFDDSKLKGLSNFRLTGSNTTWVNGVFGELKQYFENKSNARGWLFGNDIYSILIAFPILPLVFLFAYKIDNIIGISSSQLNTISKVGILIPILFILLYGFRILFNYIRWVYPYIEYFNGKNNKTNIHKNLVWAPITAISGYVIIEFCKWLY